MSSRPCSPAFVDRVDDPAGVTFAVVGNCSAIECRTVLADGYAVRLLIGEGERAILSDHLELEDGRIAVTSSHWETRRPVETTDPELGYGVGKAHAFVVLEPERSMFATSLDEGITEQSIDPETVRETVEGSA